MSDFGARCERVVVGTGVLERDEKEENGTSFSLGDAGCNRGGIFVAVQRMCVKKTKKIKIASQMLQIWGRANSEERAK